MPDNLEDILHSIPKEAFQEPQNRLQKLSYLNRLRWLQETAYFIWKYKGAAMRGRQGIVEKPEDSH